MRCPSCSSEAPAGGRFCPACAAPLTPSGTATLTTLGPGPAAGSGAPGRQPSSDSGSSAGGRFVPGTILAARYRLIGLLGTGGMGEVYRADDLKLGQPVALKFLPPALAQDPSRIARFFNEVRIARQVAHPNVCRVYDLGEAEGLHFLSMEYVDGEDLASLLRRIGRMPQDRAIQIARQLCAGLAAAHQQGFLHRDLKPANVMIDGRGNARITDFGLAAVARELAPGDLRVGTPAYMAPEQLEGREVSVRSDVYALGLVLYELFTGRAPFRADTPAEMLRTQQQSPPPSPASVIDGLDPAVERAILRCLEMDPRHRPTGPLAVAAALPGGDPLAAALAAGETPSPEMVADAGEVGGLSFGAAAACLAVILLGLPAIALVCSRMQFAGRLALPKPPEALSVEARELVTKIGYTETPADTAFGFDYDGDYILNVQNTETAATRWDRIGEVRPSPVYFWYRQSPRPLVPTDASGRVGLNDPPAQISGMVTAQLDPQGRLVSLLAVPPQRDTAAGQEAAAEPDWAPLFQAAGLAPDRFAPVDPQWNPMVSCAKRSAWQGEYAGQPGVPIRVEGCSYGGKAAWFSVVPPWARPRRMEAVPLTTSQSVAGAIGLAVGLGLLAAGLLLARRNLRVGRSDRRGAYYMALIAFSTQVLSWLLRADHVAGFSEVELAVRAIENALLFAALVWIVYIALEPSVRRLWPDVLISWSRLFAGRARDPLVGRDLLVGGAAGVAVVLGLSLLNLVPGWLGLPPAVPQLTALDSLVGARQTVGLWLASQVSALGQPMGVLFLVLLLRVLVRRQWIAVGVVVLLFATVSALLRTQQPAGSAAPAWVGPLAIFLVAALVWSVIMTVMIRLGLLACVFVFFIANSALVFPLTTDLTHWYAARSMFSLAIVAALSLYAFTIARTGRALRWEELLSPQ